MKKVAAEMSLKLLIVEDEVIIRMLVVNMLEELGHSVAGQAGSVGQALELIGGGLAFDCAILDINLAGQKVTPVADALAKNDIPFVFATGYGTAGIPEHFRGTPCLQKPYAIESLSQTISMLQQRR